MADDGRIALSRHEKEAILRMELESAAGRVVLVKKKDGEWQVAGLTVALTRPEPMI